MQTIAVQVLVPLGFALVLWMMGSSVAVIACRRTGPGPVLSGFPIGVGIVATVALGQVFLPYSFGFPSILVCWTAALAGAVVLRRWWSAPRSAWTGWRAAVWTSALLLGSQVLAGLVLWTAGGGTWETVSQTWDAFFDTNAIRHGFESGDLAPSRLADFAYPEPVHAWYPSTFHALGALTMHLGAGDAVVASNVVAAVLAGGLWSSTVTIGARSVLGSSRQVTVAAMVLMWGLWGMPWGPLGWGVLWATAMATAFAPLVVAGFAGVMGLGVGAATAGERVRKGWLMVAGLLGMAISHPRIVIVLAVLLLGLWTWYWGRVAVAVDPTGRRRLRWVPLAALVGPLGALGFIVLFVARRSIEARNWGVDQPWWEEILRYAVGAPVQSSPQVLVALLVAIGLVVALRSRALRWLAALALGAVALDVLTAVTQGVTVTNGLMRFWYNDRFRTVGLVSFPLLLVAITGGRTALEWTRERWTPNVRRVGTALACVLVVLSGAWGAGRSLSGRYASAAADPTSSVVSPEERAFFKVIADVVKPDELVLNNPNDGSAFLYAYENRKPVFVLAGGVKGSTVNGYALRLLLNQEHPVLACRRLLKDGIVWVLNGGTTYSSHVIGATPAPGMEVTPDLTFLTEFRRGGGYTLYKVTGCPIL